MLKRSQNYFQIIFLLIHLRIYSILRINVLILIIRIIKILFNISFLKINVHV